MADLPVPSPPANIVPSIGSGQNFSSPQNAPPGWRDILISRGPEGYAKAVSYHLKRFKRVLCGIIRIC